MPGQTLRIQNKLTKNQLLVYNPNMSITVAINSSTDQAAVAIININGGKILAEKSWPSHRDEAEKIIPAINALLKKSRLQCSDISKVFIINGPGPFTAMRIGVTIANAIAWATNSTLQTATTAQLTKVQPGKSFGRAALLLLKKSRKTTKLAKPLYLKKPHITTPKRTPHMSAANVL